jgi:hypothetical protein
MPSFFFQLLRFLFSFPLASALHQRQLCGISKIVSELFERTSPDPRQSPGVLVTCSRQGSAGGENASSRRRPPATGYSGFSSALREGLYFEAVGLRRSHACSQRASPVSFFFLPQVSRAAPAALRPCGAQRHFDGSTRPALYDFRFPPTSETVHEYRAFCSFSHTILGYVGSRYMVPLLGNPFSCALRRSRYFFIVFSFFQLFF